MICREKTACFTGHRDIKENYNVLFLRVYAIVENLIKTVICISAQAGQGVLMLWLRK